MKAIVTLDNGKVFRVDMDGPVVTLMDTRGRPVTTTLLRQIPIVKPGCPFVCACSGGMETTEGNVVNVMYSR